ncbi:transcription factor IIIC subunit delta N-term-domain-containing protein [Aspergillus ambiguus]|uniref:uncharacterized protein n=1 Tax=Aspergillus ambiguus TaxID=176160 RepID=UPI003CCCAD62
MLRPVQLQVFPSCYNSLACSADGELALAAGEFFHIATSKHVSEGESTYTAQQSGSNWQINRFRANTFTLTEWPTIFPQAREHFSIGPEQSNSTVAGLAWSSPGLGKHRRCVLAVLTSNLLLSFYESTGTQGKYTRVALVNETLRRHFEPLIPDEGLRAKKANIRSFAWAPPLKAPSPDLSYLGAEHRWGIHILSVTNDDNDVLYLQVRRTREHSYSIEMLSLTSLHDLVDNYPINQPSIFSSAIKNHLKTSFMSHGPWVYREVGKRELSATGNVAMIYGTKLKIIRQNIKLHVTSAESGAQGDYELSSSSGENTHLSENLKNVQFTGPLQWIYNDRLPEIRLAVGTMAGMILVTSPCDAYSGKDSKTHHIKIQAYPFYDEKEEISQERARHWEAIGAMTTAFDEISETCTLHLGTVGGYTASMNFPPTEEEAKISVAPWKTHMDEICDQFDIDRDLGGLTVGRVWGLTSHLGVVIAAITRHPGDMVEYRTTSEDLTVLVFSGANSKCEEPKIFPSIQEVPDTSQNSLSGKRDVVLKYILDIVERKYDATQAEGKILYAASCCAIVQSKDQTVLSLARRSLEWLASTTGIDLSDEISKCSSPGETIEPKPTDQVARPGQEVFERCDICDTGLSWYSAQETQCSGGHLFGMEQIPTHICRMTADAFY